MAEKQAVTVIKKVKNAVRYSDGTIRLDNVRASHPHVGHKWSKEESEKKVYSCGAYIPKATHKEAKELVVALMNELIETNKAGKISAAAKFIKDGDGELVTDTYAEGHWTVSCREDRRPAARGISNQVLDADEADEIFFGGCLISIIIRPWYQDHPKHGKRVNCGFSAVRFLQDDGTSFGSRGMSDDEVDNRFNDVDGDGASDESEEEDDDL